MFSLSWDVWHWNKSQTLYACVTNIKVEKKNCLQHHIWHRQEDFGF